MRTSFKTITVTNPWVQENLVKPEWQRNLYNSRVNSFVRHIREGTFKKSLITVAKDSKSGRYVLLDGQHKVEAIIRVGKPIQMDFQIYEDVSEPEMIEVYHMLNDVKPFRIVDEIKTHLGKNQWFDAVLDGAKSPFPIEITINGGVNSLRIDNFMNIMKNGLVNAMTRSNLSRNEVGLFVKDFDVTRYRVAREFFSFYKKCFGDPFRENWLYRNIVVFTIMRIWLKNKEKFSEEAMLRAFKPIATNGVLKMTVGDVSLLGIKTFTENVYKVINWKRRTNIFLLFWSLD